MVVDAGELVPVGQEQGRAGPASLPRGGVGTGVMPLTHTPCHLRWSRELAPGTREQMMQHQESRPCTSSERYSRAGPDGRCAGEPVPEGESPGELTPSLIWHEVVWVQR